MKSSIFQISNSKIWRISALKVYLKFYQQLVLITLSTHGKNSLNIQKKSGQIVLYLEVFNFKNFRAEILQIFELLIWIIDDFINSFWLYLTFTENLNLHTIFSFQVSSTKNFFANLVLLWNGIVKKNSSKIQSIVKSNSKSNPSLL